jgi:hypothetical protein
VIDNKPDAHLAIRVEVSDVKPERIWVADYRENLSALEYARRQGVQPLSNFAAIFGAGAAEDWDGFDEAVERWRAEKSGK